MSEPIPGLDSLPSWKLQLLERIRNTSADPAPVPRQRYLTYQPHCSSGEIPMQTWRKQRRAAEADREQTVRHALAVGEVDAVLRRDLAEAGESKAAIEPGARPPEPGARAGYEL